MRIIASKQLATGFSPVILSRSGSDISKHSFVAKMAQTDSAYLRQFIKKEHRSDYVQLALLPSGRSAVMVGVSGPYHHRKAMRALRQAVQFARAERLERIAVTLEDFKAEKNVYPLPVLVEVIATQAVLANFEYVTHKTAPKGGWFFTKELAVVNDQVKLIEPGVRSGQVIGEETNIARDLSNMPGGEMTPAVLARSALTAGKRTGFSVKVLDVPAMQKLHMGGVLGVGQGSDSPPKFIIMEYLKGPKGEQPIVICGKGVTFDTGGLQLKPSNAIYEMHMDMSGGASTIHTLAALARLKVKKNVIGLVPAVENMPSGSSYRPGDVLKTITGKTIEVLNTDAEGRVILADALGYAQKYKPRLVIDLATLTGAAMVALGHRASALFTTEDDVAERMQVAGELSGDFVWRMPLWEEFETEIKGTFGDVANLGKHDRMGGAATAAAFLWQFIKDYPWVHVDIAPRMTSVEGDHFAKGSIGAGVQLLTQFIRNF